MRIKRLEIQGFKSFKDKTVIHFDHGITGIVGPNGCGKSNVVDAMFWVMGEQSYKHIRGGSSDDLIFNGSSKYNPLGMAEATLVMETDVADTANAPAGATAADIPVHLRAKEVSVTRRLYRGGEGEYFINGVQARLKDIHDLFMDTGVGAKGYSIIAQGEIAKIVNSKPEDRRLLIEEAAGIAKYKARKKEALRKLEATQGNLSRLNDVIQEIERNLASLERQAQKARQYKKYKDELLDKEMTWGRRKNLVIRQKLDALKQQKETLEQDLVVLRAELQTAENTIEVDRVDQVTDSKAAEELQARINHLSGELAHERSALELSRQRQSDLMAQLQALETEKQELGMSIEEESAKIALKEEESSQSQETLDAAAREAQAKADQARQARNDADATRRALEDRKRELMRGISQASDLTSRAASLAARIESACAQAERLQAQVAEQNEKLTQLRDEGTRARESFEANKARREELQTEKKAHAERVQEQERLSRERDQARDQANRELTQVRSRLTSLEELDKAYEGLGGGPKAALEWARANGRENELLVLTDAIDVSDEYEVALGGLLEKQLENLISKEAAVAIEAISHVTENKQGRIAVHVSSALESTVHGDWESTRAALGASGFEVLGELSEFVRINSKLAEHVQTIAAGIVANVAVVRDFGPMPAFIAAGGAEKLAGWSVVSLAGAALDFDGTLRGGSSENDGAASVLKRKRAIAELQEQAAAADVALQAAEQAAAEARQALDEARARGQAIQGELQSLEIEGAALERDVHQMARSLREAESQAERLAAELEEATQEGEEARAERERIETELAQIISSRADLEAQINDGDAKMSELDDAVRALESEAQDLKMNEVQLRERANSLGRELEAARRLVSDRERRMAEITRTLERAMREREQHTGGEGGIEQKIEELTLLLSEARERLAEVKDRLEQSGAKLNQALDQIKQLHKTGDEKTAESNQIGLEIERLAADLAHLVQNLEEKYGPGCLDPAVTPPGFTPIQEEMTEPVVTTEMSAEEEQLLGEEVERLRDRIRRLGEVNVGAIDEYEETKKRFDHIQGEKLDLEKSIDNLMDAIEHINKTSEERFTRAFEAIKDRFERLFPIVFGGGKAELSLVYPEGSQDVLDAGVDFLAQPPGKKIVNMSALSGGEKALTSVAFIFAIFMVKPSPFCLLDEVDAPLDDANIGKFNALLREMSAKSQFIVITHNKKTMELNDTLYGVTMEEPGVSKMVSIELQ
jgi:chromosome segregation protein